MVNAQHHIALFLHYYGTPKEFTMATPNHPFTHAFKYQRVAPTMQDAVEPRTVSVIGQPAVPLERDTVKLYCRRQQPVALSCLFLPLWREVYER